MIKIKFILLQILAMNSLNVKPQGKSSNQFEFHVSAYTLFENFKERYFRGIQSTSWLFENSEPDSYDKNDMKEKVDNLVRLHKAMQEKLKTASYSEQIQILTLVINDLECTVQNILMSLNTLFELHMKSKN